MKDDRLKFTRASFGQRPASSEMSRIEVIIQVLIDVSTSKTLLDYLRSRNISAALVGSQRQDGYLSLEQDGRLAYHCYGLEQKDLKALYRLDSRSCEFICEESLVDGIDPGNRLNHSIFPESVTGDSIKETSARSLGIEVSNLEDLLQRSSD